MVNVKEALAGCREIGEFEDVAYQWKASQADFDSKNMGFLQSDYITEAAAYCGLDRDIVAELVEAAVQIRGDESLCRLAWHCKWRLFDSTESRELRGWPALQNILKARSGCFYLLVGMAMVPYIEKYHESLGIPAGVTRDTCRQIWAFSRAYQIDHEQRPGIQRSRISWLRHYPREAIFCVSGLEYWIKPNPIPLHVFRNKETGSTIALMWKDEWIGADGFITANGSSAGSWRTSFSTTNEAATGHAIHPAGTVAEDRVELPADRWRKALSYGDTVLQVHIPFGCQLHRREIRKSYLESLTFFRTHFPDRAPTAFVSTSWMFSPILESLIGSDSNVVRFQKELYLFSGPPGYGGLSHIFPESTFDPRCATRDTRLQRAIVSLIENGGDWRTGGMFFLVDDLNAYGSQHYLNGCR